MGSVGTGRASHMWGEREKPIYSCCLFHLLLQRVRILFRHLPHRAGPVSCKCWKVDDLLYICCNLTVDRPTDRPTDSLSLSTLQHPSVDMYPCVAVVALSSSASIIPTLNLHMLASKTSWYFFPQTSILVSCWPTQLFVPAKF